MASEWQIESLHGRHDRRAFCCGNSALDVFIRTHVTEYERRRLGRTFVAVRPSEPTVLGYFTLAASSIPFEHLPAEAARKLPRHPVPAALLARLAVDQPAQGMRLGEGLLFDALQRCVDVSAALEFTRFGSKPLTWVPRRSTAGTDLSRM